jgi:hypothetical protein
MGKDQKSSSLTRTPNQPPKLAGKTRSASAVPTDLSSVMTSSPESKHNVTVAPASGGGDQSFMSPPPKKTSRSSGTSIPKKLKIHVETDSSQSPENFADENFDVGQPGDIDGGIAGTQERWACPGFRDNLSFSLRRNEGVP